MKLNSKTNIFTKTVSLGDMTTVIVIPKSSDHFSFLCFGDDNYSPILNTCTIFGTTPQNSSINVVDGKFEITLKKYSNLVVVSSKDFNIEVR